MQTLTPRREPFFFCVMRRSLRLRPSGTCQTWLPITLFIGDQTFCVMMICSDWDSGSHRFTRDFGRKASGFYSIRRYALFIAIATLLASSLLRASPTERSLELAVAADELGRVGSC